MPSMTDRIWSAVRPVLQTDEVMEPEFVAHRQDLDADAGDLAVRHRQNRSIERADAGRPEADVIDGPDRLAELEDVPDSHGLVEDQ